MFRPESNCNHTLKNFVRDVELPPNYELLEAAHVSAHGPARARSVVKVPLRFILFGGELCCRQAAAAKLQPSFSPPARKTDKVDLIITTLNCINKQL